MGKFCGKIGFSETVEETPGVWVEQITEKTYMGEVTNNIARNIIASESVNDNFKISANISIIGDPYIQENLYKIKYINFMNANWKVDSATIDFPRISFTLGDLYNG